MRDIITIDWGGSNFRLQVINIGGELLYTNTQPVGINRYPFQALETFLINVISQLPSQYSQAPIVMCGAVGSNIGLREVPYVECPINPVNLALHLVPVKIGPVSAYIVPGLKTYARAKLPDVMRGEETQVLGWMQQASKTELQDALLCLPGTHSKWVRVKNGELVDFYSAFSGELYNSLCTQSLLISGPQVQDEDAFNTGVKVNTPDASLLNLLFSTRSRMLVGEQQKNASAAYLSGVLIGAEVKAALDLYGSNKLIHIIGSDDLVARYASAIRQSGGTSNTYQGSLMVAQGAMLLAKKFFLNQSVERSA